MFDERQIGPGSSAAVDALASVFADPDPKPDRLNVAISLPTRLRLMSAAAREETSISEFVRRAIALRLNAMEPA